jgi:L-threonylcarbamoyladenylate synthase
MGTRKRRVSVKLGRSKLVKWDDLYMEIISNPTRDEIKMAAKALKDGHLVAFPTETVYGLGADATNEKAVSRIYSVKSRPTDHPLIVHISSINQLYKWAVDIPEYAIKLAKEFWPGPMTLILKRSNLAKDFITGGQGNVGVRVPTNPIALALLSEFEKLTGFGIAAPSANRFGGVSSTTAEAVEDELAMFLGKKDLILNGGQSLIGVESSIVDCTANTPAILRPGAVTANMVNSITNLSSISNTNKGQIKASGLLDSHYSPKAKVVLNVTPKPGEGFIAMADIPTPNGAIRLASPATIEEFSHVLYSTLRHADQANINVISVIPPESGGLGDAIIDRLNRAKSLA